MLLENDSNDNSVPILNKIKFVMSCFADMGGFDENDRECEFVKLVSNREYLDDWYIVLLRAG